MTEEQKQLRNAARRGTRTAEVKKRASKRTTDPAPAGHNPRIGEWQVTRTNRALKRVASEQSMVATLLHSAEVVTDDAVHKATCQARKEEAEKCHAVFTELWE